MSDKKTVLGIGTLGKKDQRKDDPDFPEIQTGWKDSRRPNGAGVGNKTDDDEPYVPHS